MGMGKEEAFLVALTDSVVEPEPGPELEPAAVDHTYKEDEEKNMMLLILPSAPCLARHRHH